jgi:hypothetical protein
MPHRGRTSHSHESMRHATSVESPPENEVPAARSAPRSLTLPQATRRNRGRRNSYPPPSSSNVASRNSTLTQLLAPPLPELIVA